MNKVGDAAGIQAWIKYVCQKLVVRPVTHLVGHIIRHVVNERNSLERCGEVTTFIVGKTQ